MSEERELAARSFERRRTPERVARTVEAAVAKRERERDRRRATTSERERFFQQMAETVKRAEA